ncbi:lipopolysaccharide biosynthesis protein [Roseibium sp. MMSF_3544]|uniref:lipopolysaccharide biosynthesis protein n=1 Tax=unclassified Roseibium TaxID=2629323 RepID=UPI00273F8825|nr:lipopolysaccharide biosynthesis protein [Roseibium sp. MMSF_3544]
MVGKLDTESKDEALGGKETRALSSGETITKNTSPSDNNLPVNTRTREVVKKNPDRGMMKSKESKSRAMKPKAAPIIPLPVKNPEIDKSSRFEKTRPQQLRRKILAISFFVCVLIPFFLGTIFFVFVASDRYVAGAGFAVRGVDGVGSAGSDFLGALSGLSSTGTTTTDSYILLQYLRSRELIERLEKNYDFKAAYSNQNIDFFYRLNPDAPIEEIVNYWSWMITPSYDNTSGIVSFEVEAFDPDDALGIAALVLKYSGELINNLSEQARKDAVRFAEEEVSTAETRLRLIRNQLRNFRETENAIDPTRNAEVQLEIVADLERQLIEVRSRLAILKGTIDENSPAVTQLRRQEAAISEQIRKKQYEIGGSGASNKADLAEAVGTGEFQSKSSPLSALLSDFETLEVEREFAQQAYVTALASLERSRSEADRQQRYLAVFRSPAYPEYAIYPNRLLSTFLLLLVLLLVWSIGALIVYSVRDHLR